MKKNSLKQQLRILLYTLFFCGQAGSVFAGDIGDWLHRVAQAHTDIGMNLASKKDYQKVYPGYHSSLQVCGPVLFTSLPDKLELTEKTLVYEKQSYNFRKKAATETGGMAFRWRVKIKKKDRYFIQYKFKNSRALYLNGQRLIRNYAGMYRVPGTLEKSCSIDAGIIDLVLILNGPKRPAYPPLLCSLTMLKRVGLEKLPATYRQKNYATKILWRGILGDLISKGHRAQSLYIEGLDLFHETMITSKMPSPALVEKSFPADWLKGPRPQIVKKGSWNETLEATVDGVTEKLKITYRPMYVAGPFLNKKNSAFKKDFGPEKGLDVNREYKGIGKVKWVRAPAEWKDGKVNDISKHLSRNKDACIYVYTGFNADRSGPVTLFMGGDDSLTVWHNGKRVYINNTAYAVKPGGARIGIQAIKGRNDVILKICQSTGGWNFYFKALPILSNSVKSRILLEMIKAHPKDSYIAYTNYRYMMVLALKSKQTALYKALATVVAQHPAILSPDYFALLSSAKSNNTKVALMNFLHKKFGLQGVVSCVRGQTSWLPHVFPSFKALCMSGQYDRVFEYLEEIHQHSPPFHQINTKYPLSGLLYSMVGDVFNNMGLLDYATKCYAEAREIGIMLSAWPRIAHDRKVVAAKIADSVGRNIEVNPETEQLFEEIKGVISDGEQTRETYSRLYNFVKENNSEQLKTATGAINVRTAMLILMEKNKPLLKAFKLYVNTRLKKQMTIAVKNNNDEKMTKLLLAFYGIIDGGKIRTLLMQRFMNQGKFLLAYQQARFLASAPGPNRPLATAYVLCLQNFLSLPVDKWISPDPSVSNTTVMFKGKQTKLADLARELNAVIKPSASLGIGQCIARFELPDISANFRRTKAGHTLGRLNYNRQTLEPVILKDRIYLASPKFKLSLNRRTLKTQWKQSSEVPYAISTNSSNFPKLFKPFAIGRSIINLQRSSITNYLIMDSVNENGHQRWISENFTESKYWEPIGMPFMEQGYTYVMLLHKSRETSPMLGIAIFNPLSGTWGKVQSLFTLKDAITRSHDIRSKHHLFSASSHSDSDGIYCYTGSGGLLNMYPGTGQQNWIFTWPETRLKDLHGLSWEKLVAATFLESSASTIVVFAPDLLILAGLNKKSGRLKWELRQYPNFFHSRNSKGKIVFSKQEIAKAPELVRIHPDTGKIIWAISMAGVSPTGEGCIRKGRIIIPVQGGAVTVDLDSGKMIGKQALPFTPDKIRYADGQWHILNHTEYRLCKPGKSFVPQAQVSKLPVKGIAKSIADRPFQLRSLKLVDDMYFPNTNLINYYNRTHVSPLSNKNYGVVSSTGSTISLLKVPTWADGKYAAAKLLWSMPWKANQIYGDHILLRNSLGLRILDILTRKTVYEYTVDTRFDSTSDIASKITAAALSGDTIIIKDQLNVGLIINWKTGKKLRSIPLNTGRLLISNGIVLAQEGRNKNRVTKGISLQTGKVLWQNKASIDTRYFLKTMDTFLATHNIVLNMKTGTYVNHKNRVHAFTVTSQYLFYGVKAYDKHSLKPVDKFKRFVHGKDGVLSFDGKGTVMYHNSQRSIVLHAKGQRSAYDFYIKYARRVPSFTEADGSLFVAYYSDIIQFDLASGKELYRIRDQVGEFNHENKLISVFGHTLLVFGRGHLAFYQNKNPLKIQQAVVYKHDKKSVKGFPKIDSEPIALDHSYWTAVESKKPKSAVLVLLSNSQTNSYIEIITDAQANDTRLKLRVAWNLDNDFAFDIQWHLDHWLKPKLSHNLKKAVTFAHVVLPDGRRSTRISIDKRTLNLPGYYPFSPKYFIRIEQWDGNVHLGDFNYGGIYNRSLKELIQDSPVQLELALLKDYKSRDELYSKTKGFFPSGFDLAQWIYLRRQQHGVATNIQFLRAMAKRCSKSLSVVNVLSSLFLEHMEKLRRDNPGILEISQAFKAKRAEVLTKLRTFAVSIAIKPEYIKMATTVIVFDYIPTPSSLEYPIRQISIQYKGGRVAESLIQRNPYSSGSAHKPFSIYFMPGLFSGTTAQTITGVSMSISRMNSLAFVKAELITHEGVKILLDSRGKTPPDVSILSGKEYFSNKKRMLHTEYTIKNHSYPVTKFTYPNRYPQGIAIKLNIPFLKAPSLGMSKESLLAAMKNLPSDNGFAYLLLDKYWAMLTAEEKKKADYMELCQIALAQSRNNFQTLEQLIHRTWEYRRELRLSHGEALLRLREIMKKAKLSRAYQRFVFIRKRSLFYQKAPWYNLGGFKTEKTDFSISPDPAKIDIKKDSIFKIAGKDYQFHVPIKPAKRYYGFVVKNRTVSKLFEGTSYHLTVINALEARRAYLYVQSHSNSYNNRTKVWCNKKLAIEFKTGRYDSRIRHGIIQLKKGRNIILVRQDYGDNWHLAMSIGDLYGGPISGIKHERIWK
ncbi:MAG: PQQ-like beta-propeller repeat protein [Lentisphaeria bacterium]|nr:PQQ-like beta-propeller repeat protein [Lentisphaeria bacterium]